MCKNSRHPTVRLRTAILASWKGIILERAGEEISCTAILAPTKPLKTTLDSQSAFCGNLRVQEDKIGTVLYQMD
jgi:hypothetical protein